MINDLKFLEFLDAEIKRLDFKIQYERYPNGSYYHLERDFDIGAKAAIEGVRKKFIEDSGFIFTEKQFP